MKLMYAAVRLHNAGPKMAAKDNKFGRARAENGVMSTLVHTLNSQGSCRPFHH